jgi:hypothetical protein
MADKKMTDLTDLSTAIASDDILHVVDDPGGSPINKQVSVFNLFGNLNHSTNSGDLTGRALVSTTVTTATDSTSGDVVPLNSQATHDHRTGTANSVVNIFGAKIDANISGSNTIVTTSAAGAKITLNMTEGLRSGPGGGDDGAVNTAYTGGTARAYGLMIDVNDTAGDRATKPDAFISMRDEGGWVSTTSVGAQAVHYFVELGASLGGAGNTDGYVASTAVANTSATVANLVMFATGMADSVSDSKLRIKVNGTEYFLLATSNASMT